MHDIDKNALFEKIACILRKGLETSTEPRPATAQEFADILARATANRAGRCRGKAGVRRLHQSSVRARKAAMHGVHVLSGASSMVRSARTGPSALAV